MYVCVALEPGSVSPVVFRAMTMTFLSTLYPFLYLLDSLPLLPQRSMTFGGDRRWILEICDHFLPFRTESWPAVLERLPLTVSLISYDYLYSNDTTHSKNELS